MRALLVVLALVTLAASAVVVVWAPNADDLIAGIAGCVIGALCLFAAVTL